MVLGIYVLGGYGLRSLGVWEFRRNGCESLDYTVFPSWIWHSDND